MYHTVLRCSFYSTHLICLKIFVCVHPSSTTLFGLPFSLPIPQGRWDRHLRDMPETEIRGLRKTTLRTRGTFGKPIQVGVPGLQRGPKAKLPRSTIQSSETIATSQPWFG